MISTKKVEELIDKNGKFLKQVAKDSIIRATPNVENRINRLVNTNLFVIDPFDILYGGIPGKEDLTKYAKEFDKDYYKYVGLPYKQTAVFFEPPFRVVGQLNEDDPDNALYFVTSMYLKELPNYKVEFMFIAVHELDNQILPGLLFGTLESPDERTPEYTPKLLDFEQVIKSFLYFYHNLSGISYGVGSLNKEIKFRMNKYFERKFNKFIVLKEAKYTPQEKEVYELGGVTYANAIVVPAHNRHYYVKNVSPLQLNLKINGHDKEGNDVKGWTFVKSHIKPKVTGIPLLERVFMTETIKKKNPVPDLEFEEVP